jgi:hypothetical protein
MSEDPAMNHAVLTAMLAPAFFLTATGSFLIAANNRLARIIDRARTLIEEAENTQDDESLRWIEGHIKMQKHRSMVVLRATQLLYAATTFFVATSIAVAVNSFSGWRLDSLPILLASFGVVTLLFASLLLARESWLAVTAINEEMDRCRTRRSGSTR